MHFPGFLTVGVQLSPSSRNCESNVRLVSSSPIYEDELLVGPYDIDMLSPTKDRGQRCPAGSRIMPIRAYRIEKGGGAGQGQGLAEEEEEEEEEEATRGSVRYPAARSQWRKYS